MSRRNRRLNESPMSFFSFQDIISCTTGILVLITLLLTIELATRTHADVPEVKSESELNDQLTAQKALLQQLQDQVSSARAAMTAMVQAPISPTRLNDALNEAALRREQVLATQIRIKQLDAEIASTIKNLTEAEKLSRSLSAAIARYRQQIEEAQRESRVVLIGGPDTSKKALLVELDLEQVTVGVGNTPELRRVIQAFEGVSAIEAFLKWAPTRSIRKDYFVIFLRPDAAEAFDRVLDTLRGKLGFEVGWDAWPRDRDLFERELE